MPAGAGVRAKLSDADLRGRTGAFKQRLENGEPLDDLLPEAFATVREAAKRTLGQRHYDVQLIGGVRAAPRLIAEMKTGEGKTLVATLPAYLNALTGAGVHVVTVNDYLARATPSGWARCTASSGSRWATSSTTRRPSATSLRGRHHLRHQQRARLRLPARQHEVHTEHVQRDLHFAIVDEVDSILIDEARTPLIISGPSEQTPSSTSVVNRVIPRLSAGEKGDDNEGIEETGDYWLDEKAPAAPPSPRGHAQGRADAAASRTSTTRQMIPVIHASTRRSEAHTSRSATSTTW